MSMIMLGVPAIHTLSRMLYTNYIIYHVHHGPHHIIRSVVPKMV